ncbi:uncharacterized protein K452DRAFT_53585 [Aplosporella prunicola CBS 121167]|uniref:Uncharacterized protein n=1 Tax=Aplosporella prunicola CBS 121167 TaxID=1176127 RepID=A0A6A6B9M8_9PEZI|nr:uncharacterized protein K452DRAFT_53585 [Aplosporella prunicola CBS 121167]KAF2140268.1 hypothetical protein K452DRAFT_53585 [Aplosporella prunicola CBS 121167]
MGSTRNRRSVVAHGIHTVTDHSIFRKQVASTDLTESSLLRSFTFRVKATGVLTPGSHSHLAASAETWRLGGRRLSEQKAAKSDAFAAYQPPTAPSLSEARGQEWGTFGTPSNKLQRSKPAVPLEGTTSELEGQPASAPGMGSMMQLAACLGCACFCR